MQIISYTNSERSCQMWSFELEQLDQPDVVDPRIHGEDTRQEPLTEAQKDVDKMDTSKEVAKKLIEKYEQILREEFEEFEELREERSEEIRRKLLMETRKDITVTGKEVTKMTELFEKYERMLREELEIVEQQRRGHNKKKREELLKEARKVTDSEGTRKMAELFEKYEEMLQKEFEAIEQLRKEDNEENG